MTSTPNQFKQKTVTDAVLNSAMEDELIVQPLRVADTMEEAVRFGVHAGWNARANAGREVKENVAGSRIKSSIDAGHEGEIVEVHEVFAAPRADGKYRATVLSSKPLNTGEKLITLIPLISYVINVLSMRPPLAPNIQSAITELQKILDGKSLSAGTPSEEWLRVAEITHSQQSVGKRHWRVEYDNDDDGCNEKYWAVTDGDKFFEAGSENEAIWLCGVLNAQGVGG